MKQLRRIVCGVIAAGLVLGSVGCSGGIQGEKGADGKSAYEIALDNGFVGSEKEWLESLKAPSTQLTAEDVYQSALEYGYTGSFLDFIKEYFGTDMDSAANGGSVNSATAAINEALLSIVSIHCYFTETTQGIGSWRPHTTSSFGKGGTGLIYQLDGGNAFILTNYHVVFDADADSPISEDISCYLYGMEYATDTADYTIPCTYVGGSMTYDIAVLAVENSDVLKNSNARAVKIADSNEVTVGEVAYAIGNPELEGVSVTQGVVSVDSESVTTLAADDQTSVTFRELRTDAAINQGNSGGGLFNANGELIGIVHAKSSSEDIDGFGYVIPSNIAKYAADNIIDQWNGSDPVQVKKAALGIMVYVASSSARYDAASGKTYIEETIKADSAVEGGKMASYVQEGDILVSLTVDGDTLVITRQYQSIDKMLTVREGSVVTLRVLRGGEYLDFTVTYEAKDFSIVA
ncbi:MAG: S1C family serine protease [Christensenellaceae bacterium]